MRRLDPRRVAAPAVVSALVAAVSIFAWRDADYTLLIGAWLVAAVVWRLAARPRDAHAGEGRSA